MFPIFPLILILLSSAATAASHVDPSPAVIRAANDFTHVAELADPWVVNISSTRMVRQQLPVFWQDFFAGDPRGQDRVTKRQSLGSGLVLSADGQILTNAHVVADADEITVRLQNGSEYIAKVIGEDEAVDLAILKIEPKTRLKPARFGDSSKVKIGEWAIAIGNPLGFDHTLTVGVISAKERAGVYAGGNRYQNFLQTDASINHGNSGGPLCNIKGEVIGINTAISTPNDGSIGIGFAIPINMVKRAIPDLIKAGRVQTPRLGFYTQDIDARLAQALSLESPHGVLISDVAAGGAAEKAGIKRGDVIIQLAKKEIANTSALRTRLYEITPGEPIPLTLKRKGTTIELLIENAKSATVSKSDLWHGLRVISNNTQLAQQRGLALAEGVLVTHVTAQSSASKVGIQAGDLLLELNQSRLQDEKDWKKITRRVDERDQAVLLLVRGRQSAYVALPGEE